MTKNVHFKSSDLCKETPEWLFKRLDDIFCFQKDVCANIDNTKCDEFFSEETDGLTKDWTGCCWMNPPYGRETKKWIHKAVESAHNGCSVVVLVAARTETRWFQEIWNHAKYITFIKGRIKFVGEKDVAPFPSALAVFGDEIDLPPDREMTFLAELGTVVRPVWKYAPIAQENEKKVISVPFIGTVAEYRKSRGEVSATPEERHPVFYDVKELKDASKPQRNLDQEEKSGGLLFSTTGLGENYDTENTGKDN